MIISAGADVFELAAFYVMLFSVHALEDETLNLVGGVESQPLLLVELGGILLQHGSQIGGVRSAVLVYHLAEDHDFARSENIGRRPIERVPVHAQPQVALFLGSKA